jgi:hypothetical protein
MHLFGSNDPDCKSDTGSFEGRLPQGCGFPRFGSMPHSEGRTLPSLRMEIGTAVTYRGRVCVLRGLDPMSVDERRALLEDQHTGDSFWVPLAEVGEPPCPDPVA